MTGNGKAIAHAILVGGSLVASAVAIGAGFYWAGAFAGEIENHKDEDCHRRACERLNMIERELTGLKSTVRETGKATDDKIKDLKDQQQRNHDELKQLLRQRN